MMIQGILTGIASASFAVMVTLIISRRKNTADAVNTEFETYKQLVNDIIKKLEEIVCLKNNCNDREKLTKNEF